MPRSRARVTSELIVIPSPLRRGLAILEALQARGTLKEVGERLQIQRQGCYSGVHLFALLVLFLQSGSRGGLQSFTECHAGALEAAGLLLGFRRLPSGASASRLLAAVKDGDLSSFIQWLLVQVPGLGFLHSHGSVATWDALGHRWELVDFDPTAEVVLHRPLQLLPPMLARRRFPGFACGTSTWNAAEGRIGPSAAQFGIRTAMRFAFPSVVDVRRSRRGGRPRRGPPAQHGRSTRTLAPAGSTIRAR